MKHVRKLSINEIEETLCFLHRTKESLEHDFLHIEEHIPKSFKKTIESSIDKFSNELNRRYK